MASGTNKMNTNICLNGEVLEEEESLCIWVQSVVVLPEISLAVVPINDIIHRVREKTAP